MRWLGCSEPPRMEGWKTDMMTTLCADDGNFYSVSITWLRDWCCLSFYHGEIEVLVAIDGGCCTRTFVPRGTARAAINQRQVPITIDGPLIGTRVFSDRAGVERTWKAYRAKPTATARGFPRRLLRGVEPTTQPGGVLLYRCAVHEQRLRLMELGVMA